MSCELVLLPDRFLKINAGQSAWPKTLVARELVIAV